MSFPREEFSVVLPSNASKSIYTRNNPSRFRVRLPSPIYLPNLKWEVSIRDIVYPHSWLNFPNVIGLDGNINLAALVTFKQRTRSGVRRLRAQLEDDLGRLMGKGSVYSLQFRLNFPKSVLATLSNFAFVRFELKRSHFLSKQEFGTYFVDLIKSKIFVPEYDDWDIKFDYDPVLKETFLSTRNCDVKVFVIDDQFAPFIASELGVVLDKDLDTPCFMWGDQAYTKNVSDVKDIRHIYIESDVVQNSALSPDTSHTQLLSLCPVQGKHNSVQFWNFDPPYFVPVGSQNITSIEIRLSDKTGSPIPFVWGDVVAHLQFRPTPRHHSI